jgi:hypothetical protein
VEGRSGKRDWHRDGEEEKQVGDKLARKWWRKIVNSCSCLKPYIKL